MQKQTTQIDSFAGYALQSVIPKAVQEYGVRATAFPRDCVTDTSEVFAAAAATFYFFALRILFASTPNRNDFLRRIAATFSAGLPEHGASPEQFKLWSDRVFEYSDAHPQANPHEALLACLRLFLCPSVPAGQDNPSEYLAMSIGAFLMVAADKGEFVL